MKSRGARRATVSLPRMSSLLRGSRKQRHQIARRTLSDTLKIHFSRAYSRGRQQIRNLDSSSHSSNKSSPCLTDFNSTCSAVPCLSFEHTNAMDEPITGAPVASDYINTAATTTNGQHAKVNSNSVTTTPEQKPIIGGTTSPPSVLEAWASFDLSKRRETLDNQALEIANRQESSTASRKKLAAQTREFKKSMADGKSNNKTTGSLLKAYQSEIDALTQRSKASESAFLVLYRALYDAPDPVNELRAAASERASAAEMREEHAASKEAAGLAKKYEARIAELELDATRAAERAAEELRNALNAKQTEWMGAQHKAIEAYELREQELLHQISNGNKSSRALKAEADRAKQALNEARSQIEEVKKTRAVENEMVLEDLEKSKQEANMLRRRCAELKSQLGAGAEDGTDGNRNAIGSSALSAELAARDVEVSQLKDQVSALEGVLGGKDAEKSNEFAKLTTSIRSKDGEISEMKKKLEKLPSVEEYESLKRQFETLRAFQLNEGEEDDEATDEGAASSGGVAEGSADALEKRLLNKVKVLEGKLTRLRMELVEREGNLTALTKSKMTLEEQVTDQRALISRLEDGINKMTGDPGSARKSKPEPTTIAASETSTDDAWDWGEQREAAGLQRIMMDEDPSMLDIVSGQRDRFRARTMELETENRKLVERVERINADMDALKSDNVRLYGKIRFVQTYRGGNASGALSAAEAGLAGPEDTDNAAVLGKYRKMYEDMSNPYTLFNRRERHKRMSEMSAPERITMRAGQRALRTRTSRRVAFFYVVALHLLVVLVLSTASFRSCERMQPLPHDPKLDHKHV